MAPNNGIKVGDSNNSHRSNIDSTPPSSNNSSNNNLVEEQEGLYVEAPPSQPILPPPSLRRGCCGCPPVRHVKHAPAFQHVPHIKLGYRVGFSVRNCLVVSKGGRVKGEDGVRHTSICSVVLLYDCDYLSHTNGRK